MCASTSWCVVHPASGAIHAQEHDVEVQSRERSLGERPDQLVRLGASEAAGDDELQVRTDRELAGDVQRVRHDGEVASLDDRARDLGRRRTAGQADRGSVGDERRRRGPDALLLLLMPRRLVPKRKLVENPLGDGAAVRSRQQALPLEQLEVATDRGCRDPEPVGEVGNAHASIRGEPFEDRAEPFGLPHAREYRTPIVLPCIRVHFSPKVPPNERNRAGDRQPALVLVERRSPRPRRRLGAAPRPRSRRRDRVRHLAVRGPGIRGASRGAWTGRDRRVRRLGVPGEARLRCGRGRQPQRDDDGGHPCVVERRPRALRRALCGAGRSGVGGCRRARRPGLRRRAIGRADAVRDVRAGAAPRASRRRPHFDDRRR